LGLYGDLMRRSGSQGTYPLFPGPWNGADVTVKDFKRYAASLGARLEEATT
jgi:hypothetical protein